jgi:hypothetical protein
MRSGRRTKLGWQLTSVLILSLCVLAAPTNAKAQTTCTVGTTQGFNAVWGCGGGSSPLVQGTFAFVDAYQFYTGTGDICTAINSALTSAAYTSSKQGIVVDARAFGAGPWNCASNPWSLSSSPLTIVALLPAGTINLSTTWQLPAHTKLIGEGSNLTILKAISTGFSGSGDMIDMGPPYCTNADYPAITIEHLAVNGNNATSLNGIINACAQELSYVDDVSFTQISLVALGIASKNAANSGPYTKLTMSNVGTCLSISSPTQATSLYDMRGVHGLSCTLSSTATSGILLDAANASLEDITITGTSSSQNGIVVGSRFPSPNNLLFNIRGSSLTDVIQLSNQTYTPTPTVTAPNCPATNSSTYDVCNITILGVTSSSSTNSIDDKITSTTLTDAYVGMYILGEPVESGSTPTAVGNSRLTTSPNTPSWSVGSSAASSMQSCVVGSIYSQTSGSGSTTLFGCNGTWAAIR